MTKNNYVKALCASNCGMPTSGFLPTQIQHVECGQVSLCLQTHAYMVHLVDT